MRKSKFHQIKKFFKIKKEESIKVNVNNLATEYI